MAPRALGRHGFALLLVLSVLVLLSAIALHLTATGRTEARIAYNLVGSAQAEAVADAGIARAVLAVLDPRSAQGLAIGGVPQRLALPGGSATVLLEDENGKVNPNLAPEWLIAALLRTLGVDADHATQLAAAIVQYRAVGLAYTPAGTPIETVDELIRVPGMTPALMAALRPYLSIFSSVAMPDPGAAAPAVASALASAAAKREMMPGGGAAALSSGGRPTVAITVTAHTGTGAAFVRRAVVAVDPSAAAGYVVLAWERGELPQR
jgi:general secretion pathway protein K